MDGDPFARQIGAISERVAALRWRSGETHQSQDEVFADAIEELQTAMEELQVAEEKIQSLNQELERRVGERTAQLKAADQLNDELLVREQSARTEAEVAQQRLAFLAGASSVLAASLDYETTLANVARLAVPHLADWCIVDMVSQDQSISQVAVAHVDPAKEELARDLRRRYPADPAAPHGVWEMLLIGQSEMLSEVPDTLLETTACDAEHLQIRRVLGLHSSMHVPLLARGRTLGAIWFATAESGRRYEPADLVLAEELARRAALAIDNARLYHECQESSRRAAVAIDNARLYRESQEAILHKKEQSLALVDALLTTAPVGVAFLDQDLRYVRINPCLAAINGVPLEEHLDRTVREVLPKSAPTLEPLLFQVLETGEPIVNLELSGETPAAPEQQRHWLVSTFPVRDRDALTLGIGVVVRDITERKQAEEELRVRACQQAAVAELSQDALEATDLSALMDQAAALVAQTLHLEYAEILELRPDDETLLLRAGAGWKDGYVGHAIAGMGIASQAGYTLLSQGPVIVADLRAEKRFSGSPLLHDHRVVSGISVIISRPDGPFGILGAHTAKRRTFTQDDIHFLQAVANILATAMERTRTEEALRASEEHLRLLVEGVKDYAIFMLDPGGRVVSWNAGAQRMKGYQAEEIIGRHFSCFYAREDRECGAPTQALNLAAAEGWSENEGWRVRKDGSRFWADSVMTPLRDGAGQLCGFSNMTRDITQHRRAQEEQRHLTTLLEHEREILGALTQSFLGTTPQLPGLEVASFYQPAAKADRVGGDYFDFIPLDRHRLGVVIGDVCGKGLQAAIYTAMAKYTLRAYALETADPEKVLYRVNETLYHEIIEEEMYVTLAYGVLDLEAGTLTYTNAGHPAPVLYDPASQSCQHLEVTGGVVGAFPRWSYQQRTLSLPPGAVVALFTDGVTEAAGAEALMDDGAVPALLQQHAREGVDVIARAIFDWAHDRAGGNLRDDVAIVVLRRGSSSRCPELDLRAI